MRTYYETGVNSKPEISTSSKIGAASHCFVLASTAAVHCKWKRLGAPPKARMWTLPLVAMAFQETRPAHPTPKGSSSSQCSGGAFTLHSNGCT